MPNASNLTNHLAAVLFDLDGTLLDTADDLGAALNYVLAKYNKPAVAAKHYRPIASDGALGLLNLGFGEDIAQYDYESLRQQFLDYYEQNIADHTCLYPGVGRTFTTVRRQQYPLGHNHQ